MLSRKSPTGTFNREPYAANGMARSHSLYNRSNLSYASLLLPQGTVFGVSMAQY